MRVCPHGIPGKTKCGECRRLYARDAYKRNRKERSKEESRRAAARRLRAKAKRAETQYVPDANDIVQFAEATELPPLVPRFGYTRADRRR